MQQGSDATENIAQEISENQESPQAEQAVSLTTPLDNDDTARSPEARDKANPDRLKKKTPQKQSRSRSMSPSKNLSGPVLIQRKLGKEDMQAMAERLSRVETKEKKEEKAHPMQLKYEYDAKSRKYTEKYIRAKKVSGEAQMEYLKALAERCVTRQQQTEAALRQKYLKPLNSDAKRVTKAGMEEHLAKLQRLFQGQGVVDRPVKG